MFSIGCIIIITIVLLSTAGFANAQSYVNCQSSGVDVANGGTYYFNLASQAPFSFKSFFSQCVDTTTPILQFPSGVQYTCSSMNVAVALGESVCPIQHGQMLAGQYMIFFPEIGFARDFSVVNAQTTVLVTSTLTATGTVTPTTTIEAVTTITVSDTITLPTLTVTIPAVTKGTLTISPITTTTITQTTIRTVKTTTTITVTSTSTKLPTPFCTSMATVAAKMDSAATPTMIPRIRRDLLHAAQHFDARALALAKRDGPDGNPTTIMTTLVPTAIIVIATPGATTTTTFTVDATTTITSTPAPFTTFSGTVESTVMLSTKTATSTVRTKIITTVTMTKTHSLKATLTAQPTKC